MKRRQFLGAVGGAFAGLQTPSMFAADSPSAAQLSAVNYAVLMVMMMASSRQA